MKFNDANAGLMTMQSDCLARQQHWVPIRKHENSSLNHALKEISFH